MYITEQEPTTKTKNNFFIDLIYCFKKKKFFIKVKKIFKISSKRRLIQAGNCLKE